MYLPYLMCGYAATVILMLAGCYAFSWTMPGLRGLRLLMWALCCGLLGVLLLALRPVAPPWVTILVANAALFACSLLIYGATAEILNARPSFLPWGIGGLGPAFVALFYFTYSHEELTARIHICSACFAVYASARAWMLFTHRETGVDEAGSASALDSLITALVWLQ